MSRKIEKLEGLVVVTGGSSGIGLELAKLAAADGCQLILAADTSLERAAQEVREAGATGVETLEVDLATREGAEKLIALVEGREVAALFANAGHGGGGAFLDQDWDEARHIVETNVTATLWLIQRIGREMRRRDRGHILVTGSLAGELPGAFQLVYNSSKAFLNDFCAGLRNELKDSGVVVSCLMPGATETEFFERAHMEDTKVGQQDKADPAKVAWDGYSALLRDDDSVVSGFMNKVQALFADILPDPIVAQMHRRMAEPSRAEPAHPA